MRRRVKRAVVESTADLGLSIANLDRTRSRREFNVDVAAVLQEILRREAYRDDYECVTAPLLYEEMNYERAASAVGEIAEALRKAPGQ